MALGLNLGMAPSHFKGNIVHLCTNRTHSVLHMNSLIDKEFFNKDIAPKLWSFLGLGDNLPMQRFKEIVKQSPGDERLEGVISNWDEVENVFLHSDMSFFRNRKKVATCLEDTTSTLIKYYPNNNNLSQSSDGTWSLLLPICSKVASWVVAPKVIQEDKYTDLFVTI